MNIKEFMNMVFMIETKQIMAKHHYISFALMSSEIEFLGACLDPYEFRARGLSADRFRNAIKELFPESYQNYNRANYRYDLYSNLRCGMLHIVLPKKNIELIRRKEIPQFGNHLNVVTVRNTDRLVLVAEDLFDDFEKACIELIRRHDNNLLPSSKTNVDILAIEP